MSDLISRQALIDAINQAVPKTLYDVLIIIDRLPPAEKHGCEYWDDESGFCALNKPSAEKHDEDIDIMKECIRTWRKIMYQIAKRRDEDSEKADMFADFDNSVYQMYAGHASGLAEALSIIAETNKSEL